MTSNSDFKKSARRLARKIYFSGKNIYGKTRVNKNENLCDKYEVFYNLFENLKEIYEKLCKSNSRRENIDIQVSKYSFEGF